MDQVVDNKTQQTLNFVGGEYRPSSSNKTFENINPIDGSVASIVHEADKSDVDAAVKAAKAAMAGEWGKMPMAKRLDLIGKLADGINARFDEFLAAEVADTGKPNSLASHIDIPRGAANFQVFADTMKSHHGEFFKMDTPDGTGAINYTSERPKGVIGVICPWNLPLLLMTWKVGPAMACGNAVVVKPSEETPQTATLLGEVMNEVGIPKGVYNVINGFGPDSAGEYLTQHPDVDAITFTGETVTGEAIMKEAAVGMRDVSFELGGKNAGLIFADCDMDKAIEGTLRSAFANCGQVCLNTEKLLVERPIFDEFVTRLKEGVENMKVGLPTDKDTDMGPLVSHGHRDKVLSYYEAAVKEGATVVTGGGVPDMGEDLNGGAWIEPTIWTDLADDASPVTDEIFGPCCHIRPFDTEEEAIELANNTEYGLATSIWTENLTRAHRVAPQIDVGITWVNCWFLRDLRTPFGGAKQSGIGREGGEYSLEFYLETSNICVKL
ncbi:MAG: 2-hydroxymuconic semialdehyde dehydrogenase [Rhodospirillaceae bacterium]|jgi:aminomuconate-semialdehyde/2-hydroxymuconate-6-semialdehyde dehydrogenase|nr:2-hydroxymuconic semialdehyde dehydrogenase [Rhodospirillaceae bacterium]MBT7954151.1 2-hydroxymuconic semialdehyde dehydrogenase [Rhodospirillaceae bacterium]